MRRLVGGRGAIPVAIFFLLFVLCPSPVPAEERAVRKPPSVRAMADLVEDRAKSDRTRLKAARALAESTDPEALPPLFKVIRDPKEKGILRAAVVRTLVRSPKKEEVVPFLEERLADKEDSSEVRAAAAFAVGSLGGPSGKPLLLRTASDPHPEVRLAARTALLQIGGEGVDPVGILSEIIRDRAQRGSVRVDAAMGLGETKEARALPPLLEVLKEKVSETPPSQNPEDFFAARAAAKRNLPAAAARALGRLGDPKATPALLALAETPQADLRVAVFEALATLKARGAVPAARRALASDTEQRVRRWAAVLLREVSAKDALPELRRALSDPDPGVRLQAAQALGQMEDRESIEKLKEALQKETFKEAKEALRVALERLSTSPGQKIDPPAAR